MLLDAVAIGIDGIMMIWAGFIFKKHIKNNSLKNIEHNKIILLFLASALFTTLLHAKMSFPLYLAFDFIMIYHYAICLLLLYGLAFDIEASKQKISNEIQASILVHFLLQTIHEYPLHSIPPVSAR